MPSLRQLLAEHPSLLLIDSSSARVQVGLWTQGETIPPLWRSSDTEASVGIFNCVESLLTEAKLRIADLSVFVFCEGPGSVLGIRTAAVALRSWLVINPRAPAYTYQSLDLVAHALNRPGLNVIADARRDSWHVAQVGAPLQRVPSAALTGELVMPEHFRHWTPLPAGLTRTGYDLAALLGSLADADLFRAVTEPDAFMHEDPSYVTWTPQIHQAPRPA
ncbi:MAG: peptidase M22 [Opitutaceae bacterium]|jgi:tRNA threonylcarbamoyladenosine biosynthesis protein TsaB